MKIFSEEFKNLFRKNKKAILKDGTAFIPTPFQEIPKPEGNLFTCHYCGYHFEVNPAKDIFPVSVPILYKNQYVQGKGVKCPECLKDCIFG